MTYRNDVELWPAPDLSAELLRGRFSNFTYDMHVHDTACFALITSGAIRIRMRGKTFVARQGDLYAIDADEPHAGWAVDDAGWTQRTLYVDRGVLDGLAGVEPKGRSRFLGPVLHDRELNSVFYGIHRCSQEDGSMLKRHDWYARFARLLSERYLSRPVQPSRAGDEPLAVKRAREFLDQRIASKVSLGDIADACGLPPFRILRAFEKSTGMSPHAYQRLARLRMAQRQLRGGEPLAAIAVGTGYADQAHLTRAFKAAYGIAPATFRRAITQPRTA
ncbi:MAG TPA: AraC family transcriptional regulator [Luteibacter sp.]|nr:AraC family transcriptional regulator [Luteibacter sp.]